jgi:hypothetical protein
VQHPKGTQYEYLPLRNLIKQYSIVAVCKAEVITPEGESTLNVLDNFLSRSATQHFIDIGVAVSHIK